MKNLLGRPLSALMIAAFAFFTVPAWAVEGSKIPAHPSQLEYEALKFDVPDPDKYRFDLPTGHEAWIAEDRSLPLVTVSLSLKIGAFLDPREMTGLASLTGTMMRNGGTTSMSAEEFDERAAFLAADLSSYTGDTGGGASVNCVTYQMDACLELFFDMVKNPRFQQSRLDVEKGKILENLKQRNDHAQSIFSREWQLLLYGSEHYSSWFMTKEHLDRIDRDALIDFHKKYWRPKNITVTVTGDVDKKAIAKKVSDYLTDWSDEGAPDVPWPPPKPDFTPTPGLYHVEKDIPQGRVGIGHLTYQRTNWDDLDPIALRVMNEILGGGGFTSRITKRIRSDEGLAYSAGSRLSVGNYWPGVFRVGFQSKSPTVAYAAKIAVEELRRIREELVSDEELTVAKNSFIETFPLSFESPGQVVRTFAGDSFIGRPHDYWEKYRDRIRAVTAEDVRRVAKKYIHPDKLVFLVVGKWEDIAPGDPDGRATMKEFFGGKVTHLPLRDPLTLEALEP